LKNGRHLVLLACGSILFGLVPLVIKSEYFLNTFVLYFMYVIVAQSWNLLGGFAGQISLGHSAFFGMGALITRLLWVAKVPILLSLAAGGAAAVLRHRPPV
jgi:branched-chain amino acid transport system permease protein